MSGLSLSLVPLSQRVPSLVVCPRNIPFFLAQVERVAIIQIVDNRQLRWRLIFYLLTSTFSLMVRVRGLDGWSRWESLRCFS